MLQYDSLKGNPRKTRSDTSEHNCDCTVCGIARLNGADYKKFSLNHSNPTGNPPTQLPAPPPSPVIFCNICLSEYGRGKPHQCNKTTKRENMANLVKSCSFGSKSAVTISSLKDIAEDQGATTRGGKVYLKSWAKELPVQVGTPQVKTQTKKFSHNDLVSLQSSLNMSDNNTL